tara:strand:+ start:1257 stop:1700 length:444 start_codon:yes stop_codon:yes gene_type:complete
VEGADLRRLPSGAQASDREEAIVSLLKVASLAARLVAQPKMLAAMDTVDADLVWELLQAVRSLSGRPVVWMQCQLADDPRHFASVEAFLRWHLGTRGCVPELYERGDAWVNERGRIVLAPDHCERCGSFAESREACEHCAESEFYPW